MSTGNAKDMRKQLRNVVQEQLEELLKHEIFVELGNKLQKNLQTVILARLEQIDRDIKKNLSDIEVRSRDVQTYIMNQVQAQLYKEETKINPATNEPSEENVLTPGV